MTPRTPLSKDTIVEDQNHRKVLDGLHLVFVELPKFRPETLAEKKMQVLWLRFLTEIEELRRDDPAPKRCIAFGARPPPGKHWH